MITPGDYGGFISRQNGTGANRNSLAKRTDSCKKDTGNFRLAYTAVFRITPGDYGRFISRKNGTAAKLHGKNVLILVIRIQATFALRIYLVIILETSLNNTGAGS